LFFLEGKFRIALGLPHVTLKKKKKRERKKEKRNSPTVTSTADADALRIKELHICHLLPLFSITSGHATVGIEKFKKKSINNNQHKCLAQSSPRF